jgi:predicted metal-dependent hydrolase
VALPAAVAAYVRDFAAGRFFEAHEHLEALWWERDSDPFLQGLILFAAAYVQVSRNNRAGARRHFLGAVRYLEPYAPAHRGVDVAAVVAHARAAASALEAAARGSAAVSEVPRFTFRLLAGAESAWDDLPGPAPSAAALDAAVRAAIADRRAAGEPVGPASWGALVKEVTLRTAGAYPRAAVRAAIRAALAGAP